MTRFGAIVPAFNEAKTIAETLRRLLQVPGLEEILVVDDGSHDQTAAIATQWGDEAGGRLTVIRHSENRGKGAAIRTGVDAATAECLFIQDADTEYDPADLPELMTLLDAGADVVFGSRFLRPAPNLYRRYLWGNKIMTGAINVLGRGMLTDAYTCHKGMSRERWQALNLTSRGFEVEAEIAMKCLLKGWKVWEAPVGYRPRSFAEGKKIRGRDAAKGLKTAARLWWGHRPRE